MARKDKYTIQDFKGDFPDQDGCLEYLFNRKHSRECSCGGRYEHVKGRQQFQCSKCRFQIAPMAGTIFEKSSTPLTLWFHALWIFSNAKTGLSAKELERQLGVTYKTAWRMLTLIRKALGQGNDKLKGDVEVDEAWFGGHYKSGKYNKNQKEALKAKTVVTGAIERNGIARLEVTKNAKAHTLADFLYRNVDPNDTRLLTDESNRYNRVTKTYARESINHKQGQFAHADVHTNTIEGFWSHVKRSIDGTHKAISKKYLPLYLNGFVWHRNNRGNDKARFASLMHALCA